MDRIVINGVEYSWASFSRMSGVTVGHNLDLRKMPGDFMPEGMTVIGNVDLNGSVATRLPRGLYVKEGLDVSGSQIATIGADLTVNGSFNALRSQFESLPSTVRLRSALIGGHRFRSLPDGYTGDHLILHNTSVAALPSGMDIRHDVHISKSPIQAIPADARIGRSLLIFDSPVRSVEGRSLIKGDLHVDGAQIEELHHRIHVGGDFFMARTPLRVLPSRLIIGGNFVLKHVPVSQLPEFLSVGGSTDVTETAIPAGLAPGQCPFRHPGAGPMQALRAARSGGFVETLVVPRNNTELSSRRRSVTGSPSPMQNGF